MLKRILFLTLIGSGISNLWSQNYSIPSQLPIILSLQFHALSMPFHDIKSHFRNVGLGIGTELRYNRDANFVQQLSLTWNRNKEIGNRLFLYTQTTWRPSFGDLFSELKIGAGYLIANRPIDSYRFEDGKWKSIGRKGKGMFAVPLGISLGYHLNQMENLYAPFATYQFVLVTKYNQDIPLVPESIIQIGSRIYLR